MRGLLFAGSQWYVDGQWVDAGIGLKANGRCVINDYRSRGQVTETLEALAQEYAQKTQEITPRQHVDESNEVPNRGSGPANGCAIGVHDPQAQRLLARGRTSVEHFEEHVVKPEHGEETEQVQPGTGGAQERQYDATHQYGDELDQRVDEPRQRAGGKAGDWQFELDALGSGYVVRRVEQWARFNGGSGSS